jgi:hypothetical protein
MNTPGNIMDRRNARLQVGFFGGLIIFVISLGASGYFVHREIFVSAICLALALLTAYGVLLVSKDLFGMTAPEEIALQNQVVRLAREVDLKFVPHSFNEYDGFFREVGKRLQIGQIEKTNRGLLALMQQTTAAFNELRSLRLAQEALGHLGKESRVKSLELDEQEHALRAKIAQHKAAIRDLTDPSRRAHPGRMIIHGDDE